MRVFHKVGKQKFNFKFLLNWFFNKLSNFSKSDFKKNHGT